MFVELEECVQVARPRAEREQRLQVLLEEVAALGDGGAREGKEEAFAGEREFFDIGKFALEALMKDVEFRVAALDDPVAAGHDLLFKKNPTSRCCYRW